jgi:hypothetical protein
MFPDRELENHLRKVGGLPAAPEEGEDVRGMPLPGEQDVIDAQAEQDSQEEDPPVEKRLDQPPPVIINNVVPIASGRDFVYNDDGLLIGYRDVAAGGQ